MTDPGQLAFDFEVHRPILEPLYFDHMQTAENGGVCRDCHRKVKGRYARACGGVGAEGWWALCDDCVVARWPKP